MLFDVNEEGGKPVIPGIHRITDGKPWSHPEEMPISPNGGDPPHNEEDTPDDSHDQDQNRSPNMKKIALIALIALLPLSAHAASPADPVQRIIDIAKAVWANTDNKNTPDYFDQLDRDFSKSFAKVYREATKYPALDGSDSPFDYDVITSSQDGCPLEDIGVKSEDEKDGMTVVDARFRLMGCSGDAAQKARFNELKFDVVTEDGKPVINDIHRKTDDGKWDSLVAEMKEDIKVGQEPQDQTPQK
jgi:hypothetical protein